MCTVYIRFFLSSSKYPRGNTSYPTDLGNVMSGLVRDVCMSHQSDLIWYKQPITFLVVKVNGMLEDFILSDTGYSSERPCLFVFIKSSYIMPAMIG